MNTYNTSTKSLIWISKFIDHVDFDLVALSRYQVCQFSMFHISMRFYLVRGDDGTRMNAVDQ